MADYPTRLWHEQVQFDSNGNLRVVVAWDPPAMGSRCMVREVVRYQRQDPVFNWAPPNPSINRPYVSAWVGRAPDIHVKPQARTPYVAGQWTALQSYEYSLDDVTWTQFGQTYTILRQVVQETGAWIYRITKSARMVEGNMRTLYHMHSMPLP